jgi:hypothetical protein
MSNSVQNKFQLNSLLLVIVLITVFTIDGCKTATKVSDTSQIKLGKLKIFSTDFQKGLYKTNMTVFGNELSGLTLIKKTGNNYRVVFMSELGLKYFDMEFFKENDSVKVHQITSFMNKGPVEKMMINNYRLIFMTLAQNAKSKNYLDKTTNTMIKEFRYKKQRIFYYYDKNFGQVSKINNTFGRNNLMVHLSNFDHLAPHNINFNRPNLSMRLEMISQ